MHTQRTTVAGPPSEAGPADSLTGAAPRSELHAWLAQEVRRARVHGRAVSVLVIDIDHFKSVNDAFGHLRGDQILAEFGRRVRTAIRDSDRLFRYGGDEFVLVLRDTDSADAVALGKRLLDTVGGVPFAGEPPLTVSISVGAASYPEHAASPEELFHAADARLYSAKRSGRARVAGRDGPRPATRSGEPIRLVERDAEAEAIYSFLRSLGSGQRGVLSIRGARGTGRSRFLQEVANAAALLGYEVLRLRGTGALQRRTLGALIEADPALELPAKAGAAALGDTLAARMDARSRTGVLLVADDFQSLDPTTLGLLQRLLESSSVPVLGLVCAVDPAHPAGAMTPTARHGAALELRAFSQHGVRSWLRQTLQWEPPPEFLNWLHGETRGMPGRLSAALARLEELGVLVCRDDEWQLAPHFANHSIGAALESAPSDPGAAILAAATGVIEGRDAEIRSAKQLLRDSRLLTLVGPGGFGKTRLALQIAGELASERRHRVVIVPLAGLSSPESVLPAIAEALRVPPGSGVDPLAKVIEFLGDRELLLVLDNFEHVQAAAAQVEALCAGAPRLRILVTSRERLGVAGEEALPLQGVELPMGADPEQAGRAASVRLFTQHALRHRPGWQPSGAERAHVAAICRRLEGIPLAIELAAALVRVLSCEEILREIDRDLDALAAPTAEGHERHASLRAVFESTWQLLSAQEREALRRLSVFRGGFRRAAAEAVAGASLPVLRALVDKSLLSTPAPGRYQLHEVLRHYAWERLRLDPAEAAATQAGMCNFFSDFVYSRGDRSARVEPSQALEQVAEEVDNVRAALRWAVEAGRPEHAKRLLQGLFRFLDLGCRYQEGKELFAWAAERVDDPALATMVVARQGYFCAKLGEYKLASRLLRRSLAAYRRLADKSDVPLALFSLGMVATNQGRYREAERLFRRSLRIFRESGSEYGQALCLNELGARAFVQGAYDEAEKRFRQSLEIREAIHDPAGTARCLSNLGMIADLRGRRADARTLFERSLEVSRSAGDRRQTAIALNNLGVLGRRIGEDEDAQPLLHEAGRFLHEALALFGEIGARGGVALAVYNLADLALVLGDLARARDRFLDAADRTAAEGAIPLLLTVLTGGARLLLRVGDVETALELLGAVEAHPATVDQDIQTVRRLLEERCASPDAERAAAARRRGAAQDLDAVLARFRDALRRLAPAPADVDPDPPPAPAGRPGPRRPIGGTVAELIAEGQDGERNGQPASARACYEAALGRLDVEHADRAAALARWIGRTYVAEGDLEAAADCVELSIAIAKARGDVADQAQGTNLRGAVAFHRGELDDAVAAYRLSREFALRAGEEQLVAMIEHNLGVVANVRGDVVRALDHFGRSLDGFQRLGQTASAMEVLNSLGLAHARLGRYEEAEQNYAEVIRGCIETGDIRLRLFSEGNRIAVWIQQRRFGEARAACEDALRLAQRLGERRPLGELSMRYGVILRETGEDALAEEQLERALDIATEVKDSLLAAETSREQVELYWRRQRNRETLQALNRAHRLFSQLQARRELADIDRRTAELEAMFLDIVQRWSESIESADAYTQGHCVRVADHACALARAAGMDEKTLFWFRLGALLHDVGKIVVPSEVLNKPAQLTPEERALIERHPDAGVELLEGIEFPWDIRPMVRHHHERWEGRGYPTGIAGEEIPMSARILCIADVYDALTSDRPYRAGFSHEKAIDIMENGMRGHFDPSLFVLFKEITEGGELDAGPNRRLRVVA